MKYIFFLVFFLSIVNASSITIASSINCPYSCDSKDTNQGFVVDMISTVFKKLGYDVIYVNTSSYEDALLGVKEGKFDMIIGANSHKNPELIYMKKPLGYTYNIIAQPKSSKWKYESIQSLEKVRLAVIQELVYDEDLSEYINKNVDDIARIQIKSGDLARKQNLRRLYFKKVDAVIDDRISFRYFYFKTKKPFPFKIAHTSKSDPIEIAFSPQSYRSRKYKELLYNGLKKLKGTKTLKDIMQAYGLTEAYIRPVSNLP